VKYPHRRPKGVNGILAVAKRGWDILILVHSPPRQTSAAVFSPMECARDYPSMAPSRRIGQTGKEWNWSPRRMTPPIFLRSRSGNVEKSPRPSKIPSFQRGLNFGPRCRKLSGRLRAISVPPTQARSFSIQPPPPMEPASVKPSAKISAAIALSPIVIPPTTSCLTPQEGHPSAQQVHPRTGGGRVFFCGSGTGPVLGRARGKSKVN